MFAKGLIDDILFSAIIQTSCYWSYVEAWNLEQSKSVFLGHEHNKASFFCTAEKYSIEHCVSFSSCPLLLDAQAGCMIQLLLSGAALNIDVCTSLHFAVLGNLWENVWERHR